MMVKVNLKGALRHYIPAMVIRIDKDWATIKPIRHRRAVTVPLSSLVIWKSRNEPSYLYVACGYPLIDGCAVRPGAGVCTWMLYLDPLHLLNYVAVVTFTFA